MTNYFPKVSLPTLAVVYRSQRSRCVAQGRQRIPTENVHRSRHDDAATAGWTNWMRRPIYMRPVRNRSQNEPLNGAHLVAKVRIAARCALRSIFVRCSVPRRETTAGVGFQSRRVSLPSDIRTVSRVRARETESYREWRVPGEISKFPFNGIIKRSGGARGREAPRPRDIR